MKNILENLFESLDINKNNGLMHGNSDTNLGNFQQLFYTQAKEKIGVDAVYFLRDTDGIAKIPLIYFSMMETYNPNMAARLHQLSWNMGEAPLLFVVTPTELKIFNNYKTPQNVDGSLDPNAGLIDTISLITDLETQRQKLQPYNRSLLESGEYWRRCKERFDVGTRIDTTLMNNLKVMRRKLINMIKLRIPEDSRGSVNYVSIVHSLLSRSILIKYLEERKDASGQSIFPDNFYSQFSTSNTAYKKYTDVLDDKEATYKLFAVLEKKFNGDMLPLVENEYEIVTDLDLQELKAFLLGDSDLESQQLVLWPLYDFNVIPIQIISSIYELFFHLADNEDDDKGTYYTPLHLVDTLLDEVYSWDGKYKPIKIIDPSCGSGIFLVEIYRRMVCRWMNTHYTSNINAAQLTKLLKDNIYGVDINGEAIRVASFSLSLALCDFLDPRSIWDTLVFPKMIGSNLIISDFFSNKENFNKVKYDVVIGNPPWQSQLTDLALQYLRENKKVVGDKQIAQAFSIKCGQLCKENGWVCLLMPSKGFLFNRSLKSRQYRQDFFVSNTVSVIINFSIYRKFLFEHASGPSAGVIYSPIKNDKTQPIFYCTPKPQFTMQDHKKFSIEPNDICKIPYEIIQDDRIWKIAMWGGPRDLELIDKLQSTYAPLSKFLDEHEMVSAEGFKRGNRKKVCNDFWDMPCIEAKSFVPYYSPEDNESRVDYTDFECIVLKKREIFKAPHLVIKQSHKKARFLASVLDYDAVFNHSLLGVHGDINYLKYLCLIINSKLFSYYHLMTNRKWLVERDELEAGDIWNTPIPKVNTNQLKDAVALFDDLKENKNSEEDLQKFIYQMYHLQSYEVELLNDALDYTYDYFSQKGNSVTFKQPSNATYESYFETLRDILKNSFGKEIICNGQLITGDSPLAVLCLYLEGKYSEDLCINYGTDNIHTMLRTLDAMLTESRQNIFIRRNVRIYGQDAIYVVKPNQKKYWNYSAACRDADEIFADFAKSQEV